jgi:hypothetical protein
MKAKLAVALAAVAAAGLFSAPASVAAPVGRGCVTDFWMYHLRAAERIICDSERNADGSWTRARGFFADAYIRNGYSSCYRYGCTYYPSRYVPELEVIHPRYVVTDSTVPSGEPGWIPMAPGESRAIN